MGKMITIYWRDIPSAVIYKRGREKYKNQLNPKFEADIDRAAMRAGKGSSEAYLSEWRRETVAMQGDPQELVDNLVNELENQFTDEVLEKTIKAKGIKPE